LVVQLEVPFLVILGILFLAEKPSLRKWAGIAAAFGGVALIAGGLKFANAWLPLLMIVGGTFTWAIGQVMVRKLGTVGGVTLTAWVAVFASPQLFAFSLVFEDNHLELIRAADWVVWGTVLYLGLVMTALGYGFWYTLIARHPIGRVAPFLMLMPVSAVAGGVFILGETLTMPTIIGGLIVIAAVTYIQMEKTA
jgi:O-acetylserine/cysteine efflux transporter